VRVALTGTPGTGKTAVARALDRRGLCVLSVNEEAARAGLLTARDSRRGSFEVDVRALDRAVALRLRHLKGAGPVILEGHLAHLLSVERAVVLRCPPDVLARRLRRRGWSERKVRENACAEAVGVIVTEAVLRLGRARVYEFATHRSNAARRGGEVARIARRGGKAHRAGRIDYLEEAPRWC
jgi:adenylate kinase